jgi:crossover junction endodeoxyribonuclease RuvC
MTEALTLPGVIDPRPEDRAAEAGSGEAPAPAAQVIGLDLSLTGTGMADGQTTWLVTSKGTDKDSLPQRWARLSRLARDICRRIPADCALVLIEGPSFGSRDGHAHDRSGLWWLVVSALHAAGIQVVEVAPSSLKLYATGRGNAKKELVVDATARRYPHVVTGADSNRCDAHWLAVMGLGHLTGRHVVPAAQQQAMVKVRWPA